MRRLRYSISILPIALVLTLLGMFVFARHHPTAQHPHTAIVAHQRPRPAAPSPTMSLNPGQPRRLHIAKLGIDAPVEAVGVTDVGEMADPKNASDATWYQYGYLPGAYGNAVIAAHYLYQSRPALFYRLHELSSGDEVTITNEHHTLLTFRVTESQRYNTESAPLAEIFGASKAAQVRLITCYGAWDSARERYLERLVVTATFVRETAAQ